MISEKVTIKQIPDINAELTGLSRYGRSKMPGTFDWLQAAQGPDGRYITGIDEESMTINTIVDEVEKAEKKQATLELRTFLESRTGKDLSATSTFWEEFGVELKSDNEKILNKLNPMHNVAYYMLEANRYIAPSQELAGDPRFHTCKYYAHHSENVKKASVSVRKLKLKADAKLLEITDKGKEYTLLIGQFLEGKKYHNKLSEDDLFEMLDTFKNESEDNLKKFLKATEKSVEELQFKIVIDKAVRNKLIKYNSGLYQRGQVTLGRNLDDLYNNLNSPEYASEFLSIKQELEAK